MHPRHLLPWALAVLLLGTAARAESLPQSLSLGAGQLTYTTFLRDSNTVITVDLTYQRAVGDHGFWRALHVGGGLRSALPARDTLLPLEVFARTELRASAGPWTPAVGLELGVGGLGRLRKEGRIPAPEWVEKNQALVGSVHAAFITAPLRFRLGRWVLGGPELQLGPAGPPLGAAWRLHFGLARVEIQL